MKVKFWGVRGSLPTPISTEEIMLKMESVIWKSRLLELNRDKNAQFDKSQKKIIRDLLSGLPIDERGTIGGNTPCVQILPDDGETIIVDGGSGLRNLGNELLKGSFGHGKGHASIFLNHTHWDHICGIPFFTPIFFKGNKIDFYAGHDQLEERLKNQHNPWHFPVPWEVLGATRTCTTISPDETVKIGSTTIRIHELPHPGKSFAFRFESEDGDIIIYASDAEYKHLHHDKIVDYLNFFKDADVLIFDTQYALSDAFAKEDWGHSSAMIGMEMAVEANVKNLVMFHHEPTYEDSKLVRLSEKANQYSRILNKKEAKTRIHIGYEGLVIDAKD